MLEIKEIKYEPFGNCVQISNGKIEVYVTIDFGPRIIRAGFIGGENFMKEDVDNSLAFDVSDSQFNDNTFYIRGGHRFWISPEAMPKTYYPDNEPVEYSIKDNAVLFTPPVQIVNNFCLSLEVIMEENENKITVNHYATNTGYWATTFSPWPITVLNSNGVEIIPQNTKDTGLLSNRMLMIWPYTHLNDPRFTLMDKYIILKQNPENDNPFKIGISQEHAWAAYFHHGCVFIKKHFPVPDAVYPDNGCNFETYTNASILEMETLGVLKETAPGESNVHTEQWYMYENAPVPETEEEIDSFAKKYNLN